MSHFHLELKGRDMRVVVVVVECGRRMVWILLNFDEMQLFYDHEVNVLCLTFTDAA